MSDDEVVRGQDRSEQQPADDDGPVLEWKCHPAKSRPGVSVLVTVFIMAIVLLVHYTTDSRWMAVLAGIILFASLAKFYFPTLYRLTDENVTVKTTTQTLVKPWSMYRSFYSDKKGVLLSPFGRPSRLEAHRGIRLMFENNRDEVIDFVKQRITAVSEPVGEDKKGPA